MWFELISRMLKESVFNCGFIEYVGSEENIFRNKLDTYYVIIKPRRSLFLIFDRYISPWIKSNYIFIFHSSYYRICTNKNTINITTVHDFTYEYFYPGLAEQTHTPAFGGPVAFFADFGIMGVILASIFNIKLFIQLFAYRLIFNKENYYSLVKDPLAIVLLILQFAPSYLDFFIFPWNLFLFLITLLLMSIFSRIKYNYFV